MTRRSAGVRPHATSLSIGRAIHRVRGRCTRTRSERAPSADLWVEWCSTRLRPLSQVAFARPASAKRFHGAGFDPQVAAGRWRSLQAPCARSAHPTPSVQGGRRSLPTARASESERERARARAALSHRRFAHPASSSEGVQRKGVSTQPLSGFGCLHTGVRRGSGAATARTPWCCRVPKVPRPTYSRVCKQATRVLSEWPSTEVPSGPRRLRPDTTTVLNFVVKAWMEIRARQNATWILIEYLIYNNASYEVNFE